MAVDVDHPGRVQGRPRRDHLLRLDITNLSNDVISQGAGTNYQLFIQQGGVGDVTVGAAVSQFQNPLTRVAPEARRSPLVHPGQRDATSYQLPQTWTNVANAWEISTVQDYVSIAWPVIDATFRYSIFSLRGPREPRALVQRAAQWASEQRFHPLLVTLCH